MENSCQETASQPDPLLENATFAVNLMVPVSPAVADLCRAAQLQAAAAFPPEAIWQTPPCKFHMTILPLLWVRRHYPVGRDAVWNSIKDDARSVVAEVTQQSSGFSFTAARVRGFPGACVLEFVPAEALFELRRALKRRLPSDCRIERVPDLAHVTLFRFKQAVALPAAYFQAGPEMRPAFPWRIDRLILSEELVYPSLVTSDVGIYRLGAGQIPADGRSPASE